MTLTRRPELGWMGRGPTRRIRQRSHRENRATDRSQYHQGLLHVHTSSADAVRHENRGTLQLRSIISTRAPPYNPWVYAMRWPEAYGGRRAVPLSPVNRLIGR